jgi:hypothetical protein
MTHEMTTSLAPEEVLLRAKEFFANRVPATSAFVERESGGHVVLRGQGGEEIVIAAVRTAAGVTVRASTLLFDQALARFLGTLAEAATPVGPA